MRESVLDIDCLPYLLLLLFFFGYNAICVNYDVCECVRAYTV